MISFFVRTCLQGGDPNAMQTRRRCGAIAGGIGIALNLLLFLGKLVAGLVTSSVAVIGDAVNNLSDAAASVVTLIGFYLAGQEPDAEHPFGHGRIEYISGLIVALAILLMGLEVGRSAVEALFQQSDTQFSLLALAILLVSMVVKVWLFLFNRALGQTIHSAAMEATAADSLSDVAATGAVLLSTLIGHFSHVNVDGLAGLLVAAFILKTGWDAIRDTLDPLLGRAMDPALAADIDALVVSHDNILGIHDLVYHDYGPGRAMMSFHVEVPADGDLLKLHDTIDHIERELKAKHRVETVIHMDPVVCDERTTQLRDQMSQLAQALDPLLSIHDFRITPGPMHTNLIFEVVVPYRFRLTDNQVRTELTRAIRDLSPRYYPVIQVDHSYVENQRD